MSRINSNSDTIRPYPHLVFVVDRLLISHFFLLLQQGVKISCRVGCSLAQFLLEEIGAEAQTVEKIQSIILDGRPADDLEVTRIKDGSTLALSAAMPGLVGATLRRGGAYSSFRSAITHHETEEAYVEGEGFVRLKLFNLLMSELGPSLLHKGVIIGTQEIIDFVSGQSREFREGCRQITLDGMPVQIEKLQRDARLSGKEEVFLVVTQG